MPATQFNRDSMARWYAKEHLEVDPGIESIYYLPTQAGEREIRLVEINREITGHNDASLQPIDFGMDAGKETAHKLFVLDVTPDQWQCIKSGQLELPTGWSLQDAVSIRNE